MNNSEKTLMYIDIVAAQAAYRRLREHNHIVAELESLIEEAYQTGNERMERLYRDTLDTYEKAAYDL